MTFLTPIALLAALLAIPILLLYMLRLRRREVVVSSHFLWQQVLLDTEANTPWQRLRRNLLLLLQLLILALLVLALVRPAQVIETISAGRTVLLIDASASMSATDMAGQPRFEAALTQARQIIANLGPQDELMIIRVADVTEPLTPYTSDAAQLRAALDFEPELGQGAGDWSTALTLAAAGAAGAEQFNILILSDGNIPDVGELPENVPAPQFISIGSSSDNWAVSALAARSLPDQPTQLYAQVQNDSDQAATVSLVIRLDGELWESASADVSANSQRAFIFQIDQPFQTVEAQLVLPVGVTDYLALDNTAYATAAQQSTRRVLLIGETPNLFLEQVLRSLPGVQTFRGEAARGIPQQAYDLYILDGWLPPDLPDADLLILNPPASTALFTVDAARELPTSPITTDGTQALLRYVDFEAVNIRTFKPITAEWATPLAQTDAGGLLWAGETDGRQVVIVPFDLRDSDWPLQISFPIFMSNAMNAFTPASLIVGESTLQVGDTLKIRPPVETQALTITHPDQTQETLTLASEVAYGGTSQPGLYTLTVTAGDEIQTQAFAVNLFGTGESRIAPQTILNLGGQETSQAGEAQFTLREFWPVAALLALIVLLAEWAVYHRRLRAPTRTTVAPRSTAKI